MVGADGVEASIGKRGPHGVDVIRFAEGRLADPERGVGTIELRAREIEVKGPRLAEYAPAALSVAKRIEGRTRAQMHEVDRGISPLGEGDGLAHRFHLRLDGATFGKVPHRGATRGV